MRAAVLYAEREPFRVEEVELAPPQAEEVLVRLHASGVCHSDWNTVTGVSPHPLPVVLGHEGAGVVESVGEGVTAVAEGEHVVLSWLPACGRCAYCTSGRQNLCAEAAPAMMAGALPGGVRLSSNGRRVHHYSFLSTFAERAVVPEASCIPIRNDVPFEVAALVGCAVMTGVGAVVNRARMQAGSSAVVIGAGGVGLSVVQGCRLAGAATIAAVDPVASKRELALELGATDAIDPTDADPVEAVRSLTGGGADYAFEAVGLPQLARQGFDALRPGGTLVCIGIPAVHAEVSLPQIVFPREEKVVTGSLYGSCRPRTDMPMVLDLYKQGRLDLDRLVTKTYPLEQINEAFADMEAGRVARGVLVLAGAG